MYFVKTLSPRSYFALALLVANFFLTVDLFAQRTVTFSDPNSNGGFANSWTAPPGVTTILVEAWGGGGAGGGANVSPSAGGGGAGGAYAKKTVRVTTGTNYIINVGAGGIGSTGPGGSGRPSWFGATTTVLAKGGAGGAHSSINGASESGGTGSAAGSTGDVTNAGGNGGTGANGITAGSGGTSGTAAGAGTNGVATTSSALPGAAPGGGGGGAILSNSPTHAAGGNGGAGKVVITYICPDYSFTGILAAPVCFNNATTITLTSSAENLPDGSYTVDYSLSGANTGNGQSASLFIEGGSGSGSFSTPVLSNSGSTTLTIERLTLGSCTTTFPSDNTVTFDVAREATIVVTSPPATTSQTVCNNTPLANITYRIEGGATGAMLSAGALPEGVTGVFSNGIFTISGRPREAGTFSYSVITTGSPCANALLSGTITVVATPAVLTVMGQKEYCGGGSPVSVSLDHSQEKVIYELRRTTSQTVAAMATGNGSTVQLTHANLGVGKYEIIARYPDPEGCTATMNGTVIVSQNPGFTPGGQPLSTTVCASSGASFTTQTTGLVLLQWQQSSDGGSTWADLANNSNYSGVTAETLTITNTKGLNTYQYRVMIGGNPSCREEYSLPATLTVSNPPTIKTQPADKNPCLKGSVTLWVEAGNPNDVSTYQWYKDGVLIDGATASTYTMNPVTSAAAGKYHVELTGTASCTSPVPSAPAIITPGIATETEWTAGNNTIDWDQAGNWTCGVPTLTVDGIIPMAKSYPTIKASVTGQVRNLHILATGTPIPNVIVQGFLQLAGTVTNNGYFDVTAGTIEYKGPSPQTIAPGTFANATTTNTVNNLLISNDVNLDGTLTLTGALSFGDVNNKIFSTNDNLTLKSSAMATARVADVTNNGSNTGNSITGNVQVERFIPGSRRWRLITSPVAGTTVNASWQEGRTWSGETTESLTDFGTLITGKAQGTAQTANSNGFDFWPAIADRAASVMKYKGSVGVASNLGATWTPLDGTKTVGFNNGEAYLLFVRGDRTVTGNVKNTTLRAHGQLCEEKPATAAPTATVLKQSHTLIGNPFASPLNFKALYEDADNANTIEPYFWIWQASLGSGVGGYVLIQPNGSGGYEAIPGDGAATGTANPVIASGQGFFVVPKDKTGASLPATITIKQKHKAAGNATVSAFRQQGSGPLKLYINLYGEVDGTKTLLDGALAQYHMASGNSAIHKAVNGAENLSIQQEGKDVVVGADRLPRPGDVLPLRMWNLPAQKSYLLEIRSHNFSVQGLSAVLVDKYLGKEIPLNLHTATTTYNFSITQKADARDPMRFFIRYQHTLPVVSRFSAKAKAEGVELVWDISDETALSRYQVERSVNGTNFTTLATVQARRGGRPQAYQYLDHRPLPINYYRLRLIAINGEVKFSDILKVLWQKEEEAVGLYPNPVSGRTLNLQLANKPQGTYNLTLYNSSGQVVWSKVVMHGGATATYPLSLPGALAQGTYELVVKSKDGPTSKLQVVVSR